jgi:hypothetical protein
MTGTPDPKKSVATRLLEEEGTNASTILEPELPLNSCDHLDIFSPGCGLLHGKRPTTTPESSSKPAKVGRHCSPSPIECQEGQYESSEEKVPKRILGTTIKMRKDNNVQGDGDASLGGAFSMVSDALSHGVGPLRAGTNMHFMHPVSDHEGRVHGGGNFKPTPDGGVDAGASASTARRSKSSGNIGKPSSSARRRRS